MSSYPSHIYSELIGDTRNNVITLTASASAVVDIDLDTAANMQYLVDITYADGTHASVTGTTLKLYQIFGNAIDSGLTTDPLKFKIGGFTEGVPPAGVLVADNSESVSMTTMPTGQGSSISKKTSFYINEIGIRWPKGVRMVFENSDPSNSAQVRVYLEM